MVLTEAPQVTRERGGVSTAGVETSKRTIEDWEHPDAPERFATGRECMTPLERCETALQLKTGEKGVVSMYAEPNKGVLLCELCNRKRIQRNMTPAEFAGVKKKGVKTYTLKNLAKYRKTKGLSQTDIATEVQVGASYIGAVENERSRASQELTHRLAYLLGCSVRQLRGV